MRNKHQRLSSEEIEFIKNSTLSGASLRDLVKSTGLGITTIYYQVRKFKPKQQKEFVVSLNDFEIGELIGAFAGDGSYISLPNDKNDLQRGRSYRTRYHLSLITDKRYAEYLKTLLIKMSLNPHFYIKRDENALDVAVSSKPFIEFIKKYIIWEKDKTYTIRLKNEIGEYSDDFLRGFARGLMDTDGFLNPGNTVCACISEQLISNLTEIFKKFGLHTTNTVVKRSGNRRNLFYVRVVRKSLENYKNLIGFSNEYKIIKLNNILEKV